MTDDRELVITCLADMPDMPSPTAHELVRMGACTPECLVADYWSDCTCRCMGAWHGGVGRETPMYRL